jgi:hypothetical protein
MGSLENHNGLRGALTTLRAEIKSIIVVPRVRDHQGQIVSRSRHVRVRNDTQPRRYSSLSDRLRDRLDFIGDTLRQS